MTRKRRRLIVVLVALVALGSAAGLASFALQDNLAFFFSPTDLKEKPVEAGRRFRLGGLVEEGSVGREADGITIRFAVSDGANSVKVKFKGLLPDLFREGQGVVTEGSMDDKGIFVATEVLAKHDENYMPPEVADALKKADHWQGDGKQGEGKKNE
jgi:cytochrome c-type biogenesis protein CcmE